MFAGDESDPSDSAPTQRAWLMMLTVGCSIFVVVKM